MAKNNNLKDFVTGVAGAIREKKGTTELINPQDFENEIRTIQTGVDTSDATATADDIRLDKTAYGATGKMTGTIADYDGTSEPASGKSLVAQIIDRSVTSVSEEDLKGTTEIGSSAFSGCKGLTTITIPDSVTDISINAFSGCKGLTTITIPGSVTDISSGAFEYCTGLTSITIQDGVSGIGDRTFYSCSKLTSITIPDSVTRIGDSAFYNCSGLTSITIPGSVTSIRGSTFYRCIALTSITIPDSVTRIYDSAFYNCSGLTSITIGSGVTSIGGSAFYNCSALTTIKMLRVVPPTILLTTFSNTSSLESIIVPVGTADTYKSATNWSTLADYIEEATV